MEFRITKIPLEEFLNILENIYNNGADYIDILSNADGEEGLMKIEVKREYLCPEDDMTDDEVMDFYNNLI